MLRRLHHEQPENFAFTAAIDHRCGGHQLADVSTLLGSLHIVLREVDR